MNAEPTGLEYLLKAVRVGAEEPLLYLRGGDPAAQAGVIGWATEAKRLGVSLAVIEQALQVGDQIGAYGPKRLPSDKHLTQGERKQLIFRFGRRAWNAREDSGDIRIMLAEERALDQCMARLRPIVRELLEHGKRSRNGSFTWTPPADVKGGLDPIAALENLRVVLDAPAAAEIAA